LEGLSSKVIKGLSKKITNCHKKSNMTSSIALIWDTGFHEEDNFTVNLFVSPSHLSDGGVDGEGWLAGIKTTIGEENVRGNGRGGQGQFKVFPLFV